MREPPGSATPAGAPAEGALAGGLRYSWAAWYTPAWDDDPGAYVAHDLVAWGRSRRLAKVVGDVGAIGDDAFKAYLGVQHYDPGRWGVAGAPRAAFFLSLFLAGRTVALHTYPTITLAAEALNSAYKWPRSG